MTKTNSVSREGNAYLFNNLVGRDQESCTKLVVKVTMEGSQFLLSLWGQDFLYFFHIYVSIGVHIIERCDQELSTVQK